MDDLIGSWKALGMVSLQFDHLLYQVGVGAIIAVTQVSECGTRVMLKSDSKGCAWHDSNILIYFQKVN